MLPQFAKDIRSSFYEQAALRRWKRLEEGRPGKPHGLPGELIVSLTSYPPRFPTLALTLACLCDQTVRADRVILWAETPHIPLMPDSVRWSMRQAGVEIRDCEPLGPFKKLIPALETFPDAFIVTADDDNYYRRRWLESLVSAYDGSSVVCELGFREERPVPSRIGLPESPAFNIEPCGAGGVLYPPHSFGPAVMDKARFMKFYPTHADLWFHDMLTRGGTRVKAAGRRRPVVSWRGSQEVSLTQIKRANREAQGRA